MHDIDRTQLEANMEFGDFESAQFEISGELQEVFNEAEQSGEGGLVDGAIWRCRW